MYQCFRHDLVRHHLTLTPMLTSAHMLLCNLDSKTRLLLAGGHLDYWWCDAPFQLRMFREMLASAKPAAAGA